MRPPAVALYVSWFAVFPCQHACDGPNQKSDTAAVGKDQLHGGRREKAGRGLIRYLYICIMYVYKCAPAYIHIYITYIHSCTSISICVTGVMTLCECKFFLKRENAQHSCFQQPNYILKQVRRGGEGQVGIFKLYVSFWIWNIFI